MEFVGRLIAVVLILTLLPITFAFILAKRESLKKYKLAQQIQPHNTEIKKEIEKIEKML